jgi:hypothetical protein
LLGADDALDVFGVHGVGGIVGALLTGVFAAPSLGGSGIWDYVTETALAEYSIGAQVWIQLQGVLVTVALSGGVAAIAFLIVKYTVGPARQRGGRTRRARHHLARRNRVRVIEIAATQRRRGAERTVRVSPPSRIPDRLRHGDAAWPLAVGERRPAPVARGRPSTCGSRNYGGPYRSR